MDRQIVIISDTHGMQDQLGALSGDVLLHCGDMCDGYHRDKNELDRIDAWFGSLDFEVVLCTGGNHDFDLQERARQVRRGGRTRVLEHAVYLENQTFEFRGIRFFGAPWTPHLPGWAFYKNSEELRQVWRKIPGDIDVLLTHTPPFGVLDRPTSGKVHLGCSWLAKERKRVRPRLHCFGHVHASYGIADENEMLSVNAANAATRNGFLGIHNPPVVVNWRDDGQLSHRQLNW